MASQTTQQITTTLDALLPSYTSLSGDGFPRALVQQAQSLLQRSRSRVPNLRNGEEEAARVWCVAEIACSRLKGRLNLPAIQGRPPCAPKVYKRLYQYLDSALGEADPNPRAKKQPLQNTSVSNGRRSTSESGAPSAKTPLRTSTPLKITAGEMSPPRSSLGPSKRRKLWDNESDLPITAAAASSDIQEAQDASIDSIVGDAIKPTIRKLCGHFNIPLATPHVYVGVRTIFASKSAPPSTISSHSAAKRRARQRQVAAEDEKPASIGREKVPALVITVLLAILSRMDAIEDADTSARDEKSGKQKHEAIRQAILQLVELGALEKGQAKTAVRDIRGFEEMASIEQWWSWEWFSNVPSSAGSLSASVGGTVVEDSEEQQFGEHVADVGPGKPPAQNFGSDVLEMGCLMQDRFDWLSEFRRSHFESWKADILMRIDTGSRGKHIHLEDSILVQA